MKKILMIIPLVLCVLPGCTREEVLQEAQETVVQETEEGGLEQLVIYADEALAEALEQASDGYTKSTAMNSAIDALGIKSYERVFPYAGKYEERTRREGLHRFYLITYDSSVAITRASAELESVSGVLSVEKPHTVKPCSLPNDPYFKWQWDLYNDGSMNLDVRYGGQLVSSNKGCSINVQDVWEYYTTGSSNVIVAVVDGGVDLNHPDLAGVCIPAGAEGSKDFVNNSYTITPDSHATHVAGTIAAVRNNGTGVAGIAGGDYAKGIEGVKILSCQIFKGNFGASDANTANALKWGADHGAVISQNSWGHDYDTNMDGEISSSELADAKNDKITSYEKAGIDYFVKYAGCDNAGNQLPDSPMKGGIVLFAAGNDSIEYGAPADYDAVIGVGALGPDWKPTWYSTYGSWVDIAAPGGDGYGYGSAVNCDNVGYSRGNIFNLYSTKSSSDYDYTNYGYMLGTSMACPHVSGVVALLVSYFGGSGFTAEKCKKMLLDGANSDYKSSWHPVGPALDALGAFHAGDPSTEAPDKITDYTATPVRKTINFEVPVPADPDDVKPLSLVLYVGKDKAALQSMDLSSPPSSVITLELTVGETAVGASLKATVTGLEYDTKYYVAVASYDRSKNYSPLSDIKEVTTPVNHAPVKKADFADTILYDNGSTIKLTLLDYFQDPDGDPLTYSFTFEGMAAIATISGGAINVRAYNHGLTTFEITASDDDGKKCTSTLRVLVKSSSAPVETSPAQITDELVISTETFTSTHVKIVSSTGKVVFDRTESFSGFDPLVVDMASLAPGRYGLTVEYGGKKYSKVIVKI